MLKIINTGFWAGFFESFEKISFATNTIMRTGAEVFPRRSSSTGVVPD